MIFLPSSASDPARARVAVEVYFSPGPALMRGEIVLRGRPGPLGLPASLALAWAANMAALTHTESPAMPPAETEREMKKPRET